MTRLRLLENYKQFHTGLVAVLDGDRQIGHAHLLFYLSIWSPKHYCHLKNICVSLSQRLKGVGRVLVEATYA